MVPSTAKLTKKIVIPELLLRKLVFYKFIRELLKQHTQLLAPIYTQDAKARSKQCAQLFCSFNRKTNIFHGILKKRYSVSSVICE